MGDGNGQAVGGVVGARCFFQVEQVTHHELHLGFVCLAIAGDGVFDFWRGVFANGQPGVGAGS